MSGGAIVTTSPDVIYWRGSAELRSDLIRGLDRDGYNIRIPLMTCLILSLAGSAVLWLIRTLR